VYQVNLNFAPINPYLDLLIETELIDIIPRDTYKTSIKGKEILEKIKDLMGLLGYKARD
jgi:predicted transcriptional regulator